MSVSTWIASPSTGSAKQSDVASPYGSRVGGPICWLRPPGTAPPQADAKRTKSKAGAGSQQQGGTALEGGVKCGDCGGWMALMAQFLASQDLYDRALYVTVCPMCSISRAKAAHAQGSQGQGPKLAVLRCQAYNRDYYEQSDDESASKEEKVEAIAMFEETDDWGDDADDTTTTTAPTKSTSTAPAPTETKKAKRPEPAVVPLAPPGSVVEKSQLFTPIMLDLYEESMNQVKALEDEDEDTPGALTSKQKDQLSSLDAQKPGTLELEATEQGEERDVEAAGDDNKDRDFKAYTRRLELDPTQVLRWCPGGTPIWSAPNRPGVIPPCSRCKGPRQFEFQITSPIIYFLMKDLNQKGFREEDNFLQFATVVVYTCRNNCYETTEGVNPYVEEFAFLQLEEVVQPAKGVQQHHAGGSSSGTKKKVSGKKSGKKGADASSSDDE